MYSKTKNVLFATTLALITLGSVLIFSSCSEDEPTVAPTLSYSDATVAVGDAGAVAPTLGGDESTFSLIDAGDAEDFVTLNPVTGEIAVDAESTTGTYEVKVKATNDAGSVEATATITIDVNADFNPTGKKLYWKYFMNNTANVTLENLNNMIDGFPPTYPLQVGWPGGTQFVINPGAADSSYFVFTGIQEATLQVPGDDECNAIEEGGIDEVYLGDTLLVIVNDDLTLSTICRKKTDKNITVTTEIGSSTISYIDDKYVWTINVVLQGVLPLQIRIDDARIEPDYIDPLYPHFLTPSGTGGMYDAIIGTAPEYLTVGDYGFLATGGLPAPADYLFLNVDIVIQILE